jgi:MoxR-vWA-beta-propeller ternary system domain bpX5
MAQTLEIKWDNRFDSLEPLALITFDEAARRLRDKLLSFDDEKLSAWQGVYALDLLFIAGADLPWTDGVIYLGKDARTTSIFIPTNLRPNVPFDLFEKSLLRRFAAQKPFAVVENQIIPVGKMRPISRKVLSAF